MMFIVYTTLVLLNAHWTFCQQQWIDPHDMSVGDSIKVQTFQKLDAETQPCNCPSVPVNFSMSHYKRLINLLLSITNTDQSETYKGRLYLDIPVDSYNFLKRFTSDVKDTEDAALLRKIDQILSKVIVKPRLEYLTEALTSWADHIYFSFYNRTTLIFSSCLFVLFISFKLLKANLTLWSVVQYLIFLGWVTDFAFTWINLLQEAEINKMADSIMYETMPPHCNPNKMSFWQYMAYSMGSSNECRKYHQTLYKDHFWSIAPVTVLSHQFGVLVYTPALHIGQALGTFTAGLLGSLPWGVNIILLPVLLIFSVVILCIMFSFLTQTSFGFNLFHVLQLQFGNEQRRMVGDVLSGQNLNALLNTVHRNMVEDVRQVENKTTETSTCSDTKKNKKRSIKTKPQPQTGSTGTNSENPVISTSIVCLSKDECENSEDCLGENIEILRNNETADLKNDGCSKDDLKNELVHDGSGDKI